MSVAGSSLSIGQVAEQTSLSVHTLRLYERQGLLTGPVRRHSNGRRAYDDGDVQWLRTCRLFRASGMPLAVIRRFAELVREGPGNEDERLGLLRRHQQEVLDRRAELDAALQLITGKIDSYQAHLARGTAHELWTVPTGTEDGSPS
jgi:DNA-binding transcriptional MerR regulator